MHTLSLCFLAFTARYVPSTKGYECSRTAPFHPAIHNLGNTGFGGSAHAQGAMFATKLIDILAYNGRNMRNEVAQSLSTIKALNSTILEVGCGVGSLTDELLQQGFSNVIGIDTSAEMLQVAEDNAPNATFYQENGVDAASNFSDIDVAIVCMVLHEMPTVAHEELLFALSEVTKNKSGEVWLVDIDPSYEPSMSMLAGEPYVNAYLKNIEDIIMETNMTYSTFEIISGRVRGWVLRHCSLDVS